MFNVLIAETHLPQPSRHPRAPCAGKSIGHNASGREVVEGDPDRVPKASDGSARHFAQRVFEFGEELFDWIEVGAVGGQEPLAGSRCFDGLSNSGDLVGAQIVHDDDVAGRQGRRQNLLDIGEELFAVDGAVEDTGRCDAVAAQSGQESRGLPMSEGRVSDQPLAFFASAIAGRHVGRSPGLVDNQPSRIEAWLRFAPIGASGLDISPALLGGAKRLF